MAASKEAVRARNRRLKEEHKCRNCMKVDDFTLGGRTLCADCAAKERERARKRRTDIPHIAEDEREWRQQLKAAHLCRSCKQMDAFTMSGRTYCAMCAEKQAERKRKWRADHPNVSNSRAAKARQDYNRDGRCTRCGGVNPYSGTFKTCPMCREKTRCNRRDWRRRNGIFPHNPDLCCFCNKNPHIDGEKYCQACYDARVPIAMVNLEKSRAGHRQKAKQIYEDKVRRDARCM